MEYYPSPRIYLFIFFLLGGNMMPVSGQNLIPDPGFEVWDGTVGTAPNTLTPLTFWYNANSTPDHHHQDNPAGSNLTSLLPCPTGNGNTECGAPHSGKGVLGCWKGNGPDGTREWAGTELLEPLIPGACYRVSYWVQNKEDDPNFLMLTNQWGIFFSKTVNPAFNPDLTDYSGLTDQFVTCQEVNDGSEWSYVEFSYTPDDAYTHAYVGYVGNVSTSTFSAWTMDLMTGFYAWFDDIIVEPIEPQLTASDDQTLCLGDSVLLSATSNYPVEWSNGIDVDTVDGIWVKPQNTTTYTVRTLDGSNCGLSKDIVISVIGNTISPFSESVCASNNPFVIDPGAGAGIWSGPGITNPASGLFDPGLAGVGTHLIQFKPSGDCALGFQVEIEVIAAPIIAFSVDNPIGCPPHALQFFDESIPPAASVLWTFGDGTIGNTFNDPLKTYFESGWYSVTLEVYYSNFCKAALTKDSFVHILVPPKAGFTITPNQPSTLNPLVQFNDATTGDPQSWFWSFGDGSTSSSADPSHEYLDAGVYPVTLIVTGALVCADSLTRDIAVTWDVKLFVPTAFSPNEDGINDIFRPTAVGPLETFRMQIYDRWGGLIFESLDPQSGWNGEARNGKPLDPGVYLYTIDVAPPGLADLPPTSKVFSGEILLVR